LTNGHETKNRIFLAPTGKTSSNHPVNPHFARPVLIFLYNPHAKQLINSSRLNRRHPNTKESCKPQKFARKEQREQVRGGIE